MTPYKKRAIPERIRREVAVRAGAIPGQRTTAVCHYCAAEGVIVWARLHSGRPGAWVHFRDLELDHVEPEFFGGSTDDAANFVLACVRCNRSKGHRFSEPLTVRLTEGVTE